MGESLSVLADHYFKEEPATPIQRKRYIDVSNSLFDPRSPSEGISRTPIQFPGPIHRVHDPRSPSDGIQRTPIIKQDLIVVMKPEMLPRVRFEEDEGEGVDYENDKGTQENKEYDDDDNNGGYDEDKVNEEVGYNELEGESEEYNDEVAVYNESEEEIKLVKYKELEEEERVEPEQVQYKEIEDKEEMENEKEVEYEEIEGEEKEWSLDGIKTTDFTKDSIKADDSSNVNEERRQEESVYTVEKSGLEGVSGLEGMSGDKEPLFGHGVVERGSLRKVSWLEQNMSERSRSASPCHRRHNTCSEQGSLVGENSGFNIAFIDSPKEDVCFEEQDSHFSLNSEESAFTDEEFKQNNSDFEKIWKGNLLISSTPVHPTNVVFKKPSVAAVVYEEQKEQKSVMNWLKEGEKKKLEVGVMRKMSIDSAINTPKRSSRKPLAQKNTPVVVQPRVLMRNKQIRKLNQDLSRADKEN